MKLISKIGLLLMITFLVGSTCFNEESLAKQRIKPLEISDLPNDMKEALNQIKTLLPELKDLKVNYASIEEENANHPEQWNFDLSNERSGKSAPIYAELTIDAKKKTLIQYDYYHGEWDSDDAPTEKEAKKAADRFLETIYGEMAKNYKLAKVKIPDDEDEAGEANVIYDLYVNDILVEDFDIRITVDGEGHILELDNQANASVQLDKFPDPKKVVSVSKAKSYFSELLRMSLAYESFEEKNDEKEVQVKLVYEPNFYGAIDAYTGKVSKDAYSNTYMKPISYKLQGKGTKLVVTSREEAEKLIKGEFGSSIEGYVFIEEKKDDEKRFPNRIYRWEIDEDGKKYQSITLRVNRETGEFVEFEYYQIFDYIENPPFSLDQAKQIAIDTIEKYVPESKKDILLSSVHSPYSSFDEYPEWVDDPEQYEKHYHDFNNYTFWFHDQHQGVITNTSGYYVKVSPETGKVVEFSYYADEDFSSYPDKAKLISSSKATKAYLKEFPMKLTYVWPTYFDQKRSEPVLLYILEGEEYGVIDAVTGEFIKYD
ncbi:YcdB/YcdC domain-containing protein [Brevibacillus sp. SYSU BS000544]|uniref:YcdB/YcdC domain-containing protein n=1 Tax=Brevibacillus sp. SYSU BS000544 TaxID=3416443 RepID=UPI003CE5A017